MCREILGQPWIDQYYLSCVKLFLVFTVLEVIHSEDHRYVYTNINRQKGNIFSVCPTWRWRLLGCNYQKYQCGFHRSHHSFLYLNVQVFGNVLTLHFKCVTLWKALLASDNCRGGAKSGLVQSLFSGLARQLWNLQERVGMRRQTISCRDVNQTKQNNNPKELETHFKRRALLPKQLGKWCSELGSWK